MTQTFFNTVEVALGSGIHANTLRKYIDRGHLIVADADAIMRSRIGGENRFSVRVLLQASIAQRLLLAGTGPKEAFAAAGRFVHAMADVQHGRLPGRLYANGATYLVYAPGRDKATVHNRLPARFADDAVIVVDVGAVYRVAAERLGLSQITFEAALSGKQAA